MSKTTVAIISHDITFTGANRSLFDWLKNADMTNYRFILIFPKYDKMVWEKCAELNCDVINGHFFHEYERIGRETIKNTITKALNDFWMPLTRLVLKNKLLKYNVNIIHSNTYATLLGCYLAEELKIPHVWHIREFMEEDYQLRHFANKKLSSFRQYAFPIYISKIIKDKYYSLFDNRGIIIYDQVEYNAEFVHNKRNKNDPFTILMAGTLTENKGQMDAVKAIEILINKGYNVKLLICGEGPDKEKLVSYCNNNNLEKNIEIYGFVNNLKEIRSQVDISYVCSKMEALGRVTIENMYYENLTIGADCGCTSELLADNRGLFYEFGNSESLAASTEIAINNWEEMSLIVKKSKEYAILNFSNPIYSEIFKVYNEVMNKNGDNC